MYKVYRLKIEQKFDTYQQISSYKDIFRIIKKVPKEIYFSEMQNIA